MRKAMMFDISKTLKEGGTVGPETLLAFGDNVLWWLEHQEEDMKREAMSSYRSMFSPNWPDKGFASFVGLRASCIYSRLVNEGMPTHGKETMEAFEAAAKEDRFLRSNLGNSIPLYRIWLQDVLEDESEVRMKACAAWHAGNR